MEKLNSDRAITYLRIVSAALFVFIAILAALIITSAREPANSEITNVSLSEGEILSRDLTDFTFISNSGEALRLSDLQGRYVLLTFGYTHCPDVCPTTLLDFRRIKQELGDFGDEVAFLFISVDPQRDTPDVIDRFVRRFDPSFIGLRGEDPMLESILTEYGIQHDIRPNAHSHAGAMVDHSASRYLIDPQGKLIRVYPFLSNARAIAREIQTLLS